MKLIIATTLIASAAAFTGPAFSRSSTSLGPNVADTLRTLEGGGQVWGADGIAVGKEEADFKQFESFALFSDRMASTGVAATVAGAGPFTIFAPTDDAVKGHESVYGSLDAAAVQMCIVQGSVSSAAISSSPMTSLSGASLTYKRAFRKDFVNDVVIGEKTFGQFSDFPIDVACDNGLIHTVSVVIS